MNKEKEEKLRGKVIEKLSIIDEHWDESILQHLMVSPFDYNSAFEFCLEGLELWTKALKTLEKLRKKKEINLNEVVVVELTDKGKEIYEKYKDSSNLLNNLKKKNLDGELKFQLWKLFEIFGEHIGIGSQILFINNSFKIEGID